MSSNEARIVNPELSIHKKLGKTAKFEDAFDTHTVTKAEKAVTDSKPIFKDETLADFADLKEYFNELKEENLNTEAYKNISQLGFSIKSRAATGGYPYGTGVANSLFKFCDRAVEKPPAGGYKVLKLHINALKEIFENNFAATEPEKGIKLVVGLEEVAKKFLNA